MRNLYTKFGCFLTGWNFNILESCTESSKKQLKKYTSALIIIIILWGLIGFLFSERYVKTPFWGSVLSGIVMIIIVLQIERQIILTVGNLGLLRAFRFLIAIIMAIIGSAIIDQIIFKDDIDKKMVEIIDIQVNDQLPNRLTVINDKLLELQIDIDSLDKTNLELYSQIAKRPTIITVSTSTTQEPISLKDGSISTIEKKSVITRPIENPKIKEADINNQHLELLRNQKESFTSKKMEAEESLRKELKSKQGFLEELNAIIEILLERPVALIFYIILFLFLVFLELFVVVSKSGDNKCDYDLIIEHQLEQKKRTLSELVR